MTQVACHNVCLAYDVQRQRSRAKVSLEPYRAESWSLKI